MIQVIDKSSRMRSTSAPERPMKRARGCCAIGSFCEAIEMKMTLSTPSTISRIVSVRKLAQAAGSVRSSSIVVPQRVFGDDNGVSRAPRQAARG